LRQLQWAADGRLRAEWDQTALIVAKIHNAHYTKPIQPWEIGPYAADPEERKLALGDVAGLLKGLPGVTVEEVPAGPEGGAPNICQPWLRAAKAGTDETPDG